MAVKYKVKQVKTKISAKFQAKKFNANAKRDSKTTSKVNKWDSKTRKNTAKNKYRDSKLSDTEKLTGSRKHDLAVEAIKATSGMAAATALASPMVIESSKKDKS